MSELKNVLEQIGDRVAMPEPAFDRMVRRRERRRRNGRISAAAVGAAITAILLFALTRTQPAPGATPAVTPAPSASNGLIAYTVPSETGERPGIYLSEQGSDPVLALPAEGVFCATFSPDGTRLAFTRSGPSPSVEVSVADVTGAGLVAGTERSLATAQNWPCPQWSPDGRELLYTDAQGIEVVDVTGGESPRLIWRSLGSKRVDDVAWSPDGSLVAVAADPYLQIVSARDGAFVTQVSGVESGQLAWSPGGDVIAVGQGAVDGHQPVRLIDVRDGEGHEITAGNRTFNGYGAPSWSPDGTSLALLDHQDAVVVVQPAAHTWFRLRLPPLTAGVWSVGWSPDGTRLLIASGCTIYSVPADGSGDATRVSSPDVDPQRCLRPPGLDWQPVYP